jgi:ADP-heptose:LPS heptosyltransferase
MHLAAALGKPTLAIFGPTDPELFGPYPLSCPRHHVVRAPGGDLARLTPQVVLQAWQAQGI